MTYRLLALDIDGTIHDRQTDTPVTERTKRAVARVLGTGAGVTLATGRMYNSSLPFARALGLTLPIICYQGAFTSNPVTHEIVRETPVPLPLAHRLIHLLQDKGLNPYVFIRDRFYVREITDDVRQYEQVLKIKAEQAPDLIAGVQTPPTKIVVTGATGPISRVPALVHTHFDGALAAMHTYAHLCEIGHPDGSKGAALQHLADSLGVSSQEVVAVGDSPNDVDMIRWAGLGVAMGNAPDAVKSSANRVTLPASRHGLALLLEDLLSQDLFHPLPHAISP